MKPPPFRYHRALSLDEAKDLLSRHGGEAKVLAGGQSLVPVMNFRLARPALLVDLNPLADLAYVRQEDGALAIGAMTRLNRLERDRQVAEAAPLLAEAAPVIAHPQIRNRGTVGGSLAHADPAAELPALALALDAELTLASRRGERRLPVAEFFTGLFATAMAPDEVLLETRFPRLPPRTGTAFSELARRHGDYAQAGVAAVVTLAGDGTIGAARLAYLALGEGPLRAPEAERMLAGETPSDELFAAAAEHAAKHEIDPEDDVHATVGYKRHLAGVLTRRALATAVRRAREAAA